MKDYSFLFYLVTKFPFLIKWCSLLCEAVMVIYSSSFGVLELFLSLGVAWHYWFISTKIDEFRGSMLLTLRFLICLCLVFLVMCE